MKGIFVLWRFKSYTANFQEFLGSNHDFEVFILKLLEARKSSAEVTTDLGVFVLSSI